MAIPNPSAMLAESLSTFSKAAYEAFAEVEAKSRLEVARMGVEVREAKADRDKAIRDLHAFQLEAQGWKQEIVATKAALTQAELTIAHQVETLAVQVETIAQLRREVTQWKDQSRNWQEHFLRVEQERCAQSSRIDELVVEKLQHPQRTASSSLQTPKSIKYTSTVNSAPSSASKLSSDTTTSPNQALAPPSPSSLNSSAITPGIQPETSTNRQPRKRVRKPRIQHERDAPIFQVSNDKEEGSSADVKRPRKNHASAQGPAATPAQPKPEAPATVRSSTVIRRVQAVVQVKREESYSDEEASLREGNGGASTSQNATTSSVVTKKKEESAEYQRFLRTPRRKIIEDEPEEQEDDDEKEIRDQIVDSGSDPLSDPVYPRKLGVLRSRFRQRGRVNYREDNDYEEDEDDDDEDDELMMGAEDNHDEVYGTQRVETTHGSHRPSKKPFAPTGPPPKKRKVTGRRPIHTP